MTDYIKEPKPVTASVGALARVLNTRRCPKCKTAAKSAVYSNDAGDEVVKIKYVCGCVGVAKVKG